MINDVAILLFLAGVFVPEPPLSQCHHLLPLLQRAEDPDILEVSAIFAARPDSFLFSQFYFCNRSLEKKVSTDKACGVGFLHRFRSETFEDDPEISYTDGDTTVPLPGAFVVAVSFTFGCTVITEIGA